MTISIVRLWQCLMLDWLKMFNCEIVGEVEMG